MSAKKDHLYWEMQWQEAFQQEFSREPEDWEYPDRYERCDCHECNPRKLRTVSRSGDLPIEAARSADIDRVFDHLGIGVPVRKNGGWVTFCPFHDDSNPSLRIKKEKNLWYCFPCGEGGDLIELWMRLTGESFPQAVRHITEVDDG